MPVSDFLHIVDDIYDRRSNVSHGQSVGAGCVIVEGGAPRFVGFWERFQMNVFVDVVLPGRQITPFGVR